MCPTQWSSRERPECHLEGAFQQLGFLQAGPNCWVVSGVFNLHFNNRNRCMSCTSCFHKDKRLTLKSVDLFQALPLTLCTWEQRICNVGLSFLNSVERNGVEHVLGWGGLNAMTDQSVLQDAAHNRNSEKWQRANRLQLTGSVQWTRLAKAVRNYPL